MKMLRSAHLSLLFGLLATAAIATDLPALPGVEPTPTPEPGLKPNFAPKAPWIGSACKQDFQTNCPTLPANSKREDIVACLKSHQEVLSEECQSAIAERTPGYGQMAEGRSGHGMHGGHHRGGSSEGPPSGASMNPGSTIPPGPDSEETKRMLGDR